MTNRMPEIKEILHTADGITDKPLVEPDDDYHGDEIWELLDLVQSDWTIHDLDQYEEETMQSTLGATLCGLMKRYVQMQKQLEAKP